jgi:hypothetical protein
MNSARRMQRWTVKDGSRFGLMLGNLKPLSGWYEHRMLPYSEKTSFRDNWKQLQQELRNEEREQ